MTALISSTVTTSAVNLLFFRASAAVGLFLFSSCSTVSVKTRPGMVTREGLESAKILASLGDTGMEALGLVGSSCRALLRSARQLELKGRRGDAACYYLKSAVKAHEILISGTEAPGSEAEKALIDLHNHSLARFAEIWSTDPRRGNGSPAIFQHGDETIEITLSPESDFSADLFDRAVAADSIDGTGVEEKKREGYGATLVGIREKTPERREEMRFYADRGMFVPVSMTIQESRRAGSGNDSRQLVSIALLNPQLRETVAMGRREVPLAAHFSAPTGMLLSGRNEIIWGLKGFFQAHNGRDESGISLGEPYDPNRIPVILTHGLVSVPIIWRNLIPEFMADPEISRRYQFLVFTYPSSLTVSDSAHFFRTELAALRAHYDPDGRDPLSRNMVAIGHSMGGVLSRILVAELGDNFWNEISDKPIESFGLAPEAEAKVREVAFFDPDPAISRAVFLSTPHGGSKLAELSLVSFFTYLARLPTELITTTGGLLQSAPIDGLKVDLGKKMTSLQSLRPDSPIVLALAESPYKPGVVYHSIIGDRGKGNTPDSSDGVVEYWSSHQPGAESELIVPSGHTTYTDPAAVEEMKRILRKHSGTR